MVEEKAAVSSVYLGKMKMENVNKLTESMLKVEKALTAVEKNGIEYINAPDGTYPCGGCSTYQKAVQEALAVIRSLDMTASHSDASG